MLSSAGESWASCQRQVTMPASSVLSLPSSTERDDGSISVKNLVRAKEKRTGDCCGETDCEVPDDGHRRLVRRTADVDSQDG